LVDVSCYDLGGPCPKFNGPMEVSLDNVKEHHFYYNYPNLQA